MAVKAGYKQTEVGVIPEDWEMTTVGNEFSIQLGKMLDIEKNIGVPKLYVGNRHVQWGRIELSDLGVIKMTPADFSRFRLRKGDLLVCEGGEIGRAAIWDEPMEECYFQKALHRLRPLRGYNVQFMLNVLAWLASIGFLNNFVTQTSIAHLPKDKFQTVPIPLPSKAEQQAIAEALSDVDGLISALDALIAKKRAIKQGAMQELLTGQRRLQGFAGEWAVRKLGECGDFKNGINKGKEDFGVGHPFVNLLDIFGISRVSQSSSLGLINSTENERAAYSLNKGDILFVRSSVKPEGVGLTSLVCNDLKDTVYSGFLIRFRDYGKLSFEYKEYCFYEKNFRRKLIDSSTVSANTNINQNSLKNLEILLPPTLVEQTAIAQLLADMDGELAALAAKRAKTVAVKQGMMQTLLTGQVRLV